MGTWYNLKKKIIFLHPLLDTGGAENLRLALLKNIDKDRYNIKVCCIGKKGPVGEKIEKLGFEVDELRQNPGSKNIHITCKLVRYLRREKPDILHCCLFNANFHGRIAGFLCGIPHLITEEHGEHNLYNGINFFPYILADFFLSRLSDFIVCCSERLKEDIIKKERLSHNKIVPIENCLDASLYRVITQKEDIKKRHRISDELVFITVGSLKVGKGHEYLIEVFRDVKDLGYGFKCFFAGNGPLKQTLYKRCWKLGLSEDIIFLGDVQGITDYLNASDVFVLPSLSEGLSIALLEAMLIGLASIVTDVGSNPDLIKTGFNGTVISPQDKGQLKDAIIFYFENRQLIGEFGQRSRSIIKNRYSSMDKYLGKYYELWNRCTISKA